MKVKDLVHIVGKPAGVGKLLKQFHTTNDIVKAVIEQHALNQKAADKIAANFNTGNDYKTAERLWSFIYYNLNYKAEPDKQTVKSIAAILADSYKGGNDCKHFAGFSCSILAALGYDCFYRFASYSGKVPTHVYTVLLLNGKEYILDAVLPYFNTEKRYTYKIDINPINSKNMPLYRMSGTDAITGTKAADAAARLKAKAKKVVNTVKASAATGAFAPARAAFLLLLKFNVHNLGKDFYKAITINEAKLKDFWKKFGGTDFELLKKTAKEGSTKNKILGIDNNSVNINKDYPSIGVAGEFVATLTAAAPLLIAIIPLLAGILKRKPEVPAPDNTADLPQPEGYNNNNSGSNDNTVLYVGGAVVVAGLLYVTLKN